MLNLNLLDERIGSPLPDQYKDLVGKKLLVTGAAGFIGGTLIKQLMEYQLDVVGTVLDEEEAVVLRRQGYRVNVLNLASDKSWDQLLQGIDIVFNIAALFQEVENTEEMFRQVSVSGTLKLVKAADKAGVERFVHYSTVGVHGHVKQIPCTVETPCNPMDGYHRTKLDGELAVLNYAKTLADGCMIVTVNRPAMVYGPGDTRMMKLFKAINSGNFMMIGSGDVLAHLGYIDDQVESLILSGVSSREKVHQEAFNIASGHPVTLNELAATIADAAGVGYRGLKSRCSRSGLSRCCAKRFVGPSGSSPPYSGAG